MGNTMNNPMNEERVERMQEVINDVVGVFAKEFPLHYKDALIAKVKDEAQPEEADERMLPDAPVPDYELKSGTMQKRGGLNPGFKSRFFVALNKADNYRIDYYDKQGGKCKGSINCCGFSAQEYNEEDVKQHGQFGIKIVPDDDRLRTWYVKTDSEDDKSEWLKVFKNACSKAGPPVNEDELIAEGFKGAYKAVRWHYGFYGWYRCTLVEGDQLGALCSEIVMREVVRAALDEIPEGPQKNMTINMIRKNVDVAVIAAVSAAWKAAVLSCSSMKETLESSVKGLLTPLFEQEVAVKEKIAEICSSTSGPFLEDVGGRICRPILTACSSPITKAFVASVQGFADFMKKQIIDGSFNKEGFDNNIKWAHRSVEYWLSGPLEDTNRICWALYTSDLADVASLFGDGYGAYSLYSDVLDSVRDITHRAIHAFEAAARDADLQGLEGILNVVIGKYLHDAKLALKGMLNGILGSILQSPVTSMVFTPCLELVKPIQDQIDKIPVPGLSGLFNLSSLMEEVLQRALDDGVGSIVDGAFVDIAGQIDNAGSAIGVTSA